MAKEDIWVSRKEASSFLIAIGCPVSVKTLAKMAENDNARNGPPFRRSGWRTIRYHRKDLNEWAEKNMEKVGWNSDQKARK